MSCTIRVNGRPTAVDLEPDTPLLWVLRETLDLKGTKFGCGMGLCGACTVHIDGVPRRSCVTPVGAIGSAAVTTIEGIGATPIGKRVQSAWVHLDVAQCGYCQPGQIMSACALLKLKPKPTDPEIDDAMSGNLCRCYTYLRIRAAIKHAAEA